MAGGARSSARSSGWIVDAALSTMVYLIPLVGPHLTLLVGIDLLMGIAMATDQLTG